MASWGDAQLLPAELNSSKYSLQVLKSCTLNTLKKEKRKGGDFVNSNGPQLIIPCAFLIFLFQGEVIN